MSALALFQRAQRTTRSASKERLFRRALSVSPDPFLTAEIHDHWAHHLKNSSRFSEALPHFWSAHALYRQLNVPTERFRTLLSASHCLRIMGRYRKAQSLWNSVKNLFVPVGTRLRVRSSSHKFQYFSDPSAGDFWIERALVERGVGHFGKCRRYLTQAENAFRLAKDAEGLQHTYWVRGGMERFSGHPQAAHRAFVQAVRSARSLKNYNTLAYALCGLAGIQRVLGKNHKSFRNYQHAHRLFRKWDDRFGQAYGLCGMANALRVAGQALPTISLYTQSAALYKKLGDQSSEGFAHWGMAGSYRQMNQLTDSLKSYRRAQKLFKQSDDDRGKIMALLGLSLLSSQKGDSLMAQRYARAAETFANKKELFYESALVPWVQKGNIKKLQKLGLSKHTVSRWKDIP